MNRDSSAHNHMRADRQSNWDNMVELVAARVEPPWCSEAADRDNRSVGKDGRSQPRSATDPALGFFRKWPRDDFADESRNRSNVSQAAELLAFWPHLCRDRTRSGGAASFPIIGILVDRTRLPAGVEPIDWHSAPGRGSAAHRLRQRRSAAAAGAEPLRPARLPPKLEMPRQEAARPCWL